MLQRNVTSACVMAIVSARTSFYFAQLTLSDSCWETVQLPSFYKFVGFHLSIGTDFMQKIRFLSRVNLSYVSNIGGDTVGMTTDMRKCQNYSINLINHCETDRVWWA